MTHKENTPTFNTPDRKIVNFKDFYPDREKIELKKVKKSFTKNDKRIGSTITRSKYNPVTHKNDDLPPQYVDDKLDKLEEIEESASLKDNKLKGWCFYDSGMHPVEFEMSGENFFARSDGEIWDYSDDPADFAAVFNDKVYTAKSDKDMSIIFENPVSLTEWVESRI